MFQLFKTKHSFINAQDKIVYRNRYEVINERKKFSQLCVIAER